MNAPTDTVLTLMLEQRRLGRAEGRAKAWSQVARYWVAGMAAAVWWPLFTHHRFLLAAVVCLVGGVIGAAAKTTVARCLRPTPPSPR